MFCLLVTFGRRRTPPPPPPTRSTRFVRFLFVIVVDERLGLTKAASLAGFFNFCFVFGIIARCRRVSFAPRCGATTTAARPTAAWFLLFVSHLIGLAVEFGGVTKVAFRGRRHVFDWLRARGGLSWLRSIFHRR